MNPAITIEPLVRAIPYGEGPRVEILGIQLEWKLNTADTNGHYCVIDALVPPGAGVPLHRHEAQEAFLVLEGTAEFGRLGPNGPEWLTTRPGDVVQIPGNQMHGFRNTSGSAARLLITCTAELEPFFQEAGVPLTPRSSLRAPSPADIERVVGIAVKHGQVFAPPE